jgi:hypothetical protein
MRAHVGPPTEKTPNHGATQSAAGEGIETQHGPPQGYRPEKTAHRCIHGAARMSHHHEDKKLRKLAQLFKNKRVQAINLQEEQLGRSRDLEKERDDEVKKSMAASSRRGAAAKQPEPVWSARMQSVRDKNTGRERMAKERWNRFAGTEAGGGRGL